MLSHQEKRKQARKSKKGKKTLPDNDEVPIIHTVESPEIIKLCIEEFLEGSGPIYIAIPNFGMWSIGRPNSLANTANAYIKFFAPEDRQSVFGDSFGPEFLAYGIILNSDLKELDFHIEIPHGENVIPEYILVCKKVTPQ